jgi:predicted nucleic acid-binding protein
MTVAYDIQADIIDIRFDKPKHQDSLFVDTNIWYWLTYSRASVTAKPYQVREYPEYIKKIRSVNGRLSRCNLVLAELAHIIEKAEFGIFCSTNKKDPRTYPKKEFRHNFPTERKDVTLEIESAWMQVEQLSVPVPVSLDESSATAFIADLKAHKLDGYDLFTLDLIRKQGFSLLTDDGDFATVPGISVFTANLSVIDAARACGKLKIR